MASESEAQITAILAKILPLCENTYAISEQRIPMPDGIELAANLYQPDLPADTRPNGLIYVLSPYGRTGVLTLLNAKCFAVRGYVVLFVSCRGTAGSGGTFVAAMTEQADSQNIVRWMREQPWYPGTFVTVGPSYLGYAQWALLRHPPEDLIASVNLSSVYDHSLLTWTNGTYCMDRISWSYFVATQSESGGGGLFDPKKLKDVMDATPLYAATERFLDGRAPYVLDFMATPNVDDPFWLRCKHHAALELVNVPLLLRSGWYDTLAVQTFVAYARARDRGLKVYLTVGPWTHVEACGPHAMPEVFNFLDEHVVGRKKNHRPLPVKVFVTGANEWRSMLSWPPAIEKRIFYLHGDKTVSNQPPPPDSPPISFTYDPNKPTPTVGGPRLARGGRVDDSIYASRSDLLVYTSAPMEEDIEVMGKPIVHLAHSTDIPHADLWIRLSEVDADSVSHNITESMLALNGTKRPGESEISVTLVDRAHVFKKGTRMRVIVAGGSFPLFARNPGTEVNRTRATELKAVTHTVQHGNRLTKLILPCSL